MLLLTVRIINQVFLSWLKPLPMKTPIKVNFICWPFDIDIMMHMNNASYARVAELARWRLISAGSVKPGWALLVAEQKIEYRKPISPFQKYVVSTSITATEDKWLNYIHVFEQHPSLIKEGKEPVIYAIVTAKTVVKERNGKTVKPKELAEMNAWNKVIIKTED